MHTSTRAVRGFLFVSICIIAIAGYRGMGRMVAASVSSPVAATEENTLRSRIARLAAAEYNRWHTHDTMVLHEKDSAAVPILKQYWQLGGIPVSERNLYDGSWQYHHPWSAVFVSWVMLQAGAGNTFPYSNNHAKYIVWARDNATRNPDPLFAAYDIKDQRAAWPEPGDLVCMNRRNNKFSLQSINPMSVSHCDIVVETNKEKGYLVCIGGNVGQTVNKRIVWLNAAGLIDTARNWQVQDPQEEYPEGSQKEMFGVIRVNKTAL
ncbi:MAG TPA: DUF2272 domain-containing protein [Chitinophagaceae bacterium]